MTGTPSTAPDPQNPMQGQRRPRRFDQCDDSCTVDWGHCKGATNRLDCGHEIVHNPGKSTNPEGGA